MSKNTTCFRDFADPKGPTVLLSSEIGSEGIDLQFARVLVNYDLPWESYESRAADRTH